MAGDPFGLLLRQRVVFLGGEVRTTSSCAMGFWPEPSASLCCVLVPHWNSTPGCRLNYTMISRLGGFR